MIQVLLCTGGRRLRTRTAAGNGTSRAFAVSKKNRDKPSRQFQKLTNGVVLKPLYVSLYIAVFEHKR